MLKSQYIPVIRKVKLGLGENSVANIFDFSRFFQVADISELISYKFADIFEYFPQYFQ